MHSKTFIYLFTIFFTSLSALVYEIVWSRELSHIFGTSAIAVSTVLTVFMAGLALGGYYGGKLIERSANKSRLVSYFSFGIGISCFLTLILFPLIRHLYTALHNAFSSLFLFWLVQFFLAALVLIIPTFLIGAVFPMIIKLYHEQHRAIGSSVGIPYAIDTIGGSLGVLIAIFFFIPSFGFLTTSIIASLANFIAGILTFPIRSPQEPSATTHSSPISRSVLFLFFLSGCAALMFQVIWTRFVSLIYGSGVYSFGIVLISFLLGLGAGSFCYAKWQHKITHKITAFAMVEFFIGIFGITLIKVFPYLDRWFLTIFFASPTYATFLSLQTLTLIAILLIPTFLMGITLPLLSSIVLHHEKVGEGVGKLYAINSCGAIFGAFLAGFAIIPIFGLNYSSTFAASIYLFIAAAFFLIYAEKPIRINVAEALFFILIIGAIFFTSLHNSDYIFGGVYYHGTRYDSIESYINAKEGRDSIVFLKNSPYGQVSVVWQGTNIILKNNGKADASLGDQLTQAMLTHIPLLLHPSPAQMAIIGLGGGFSTASAVKHSIPTIDVIEIDPAVAEAVGTVIASYNEDVLKNEKVNLILADGRNYIETTQEKYDVIVSEPPNIWVSGVSNLFTKEFYQAARNHLNEKGILSQWVPRYEMSEKDYQLFINTVLSVFPYAYEFNLGADKDSRGDVVVVATATPLSVMETLQKNLNTIPEGVKKELADLQWEEYNTTKTFMTALYTRTNEELHEYVQNITLVNTDNLPVLEFTTLKNRYKKFREE